MVRSLAYRTSQLRYMDGSSKLLCGQISPKGRYLACAGQEHLLYLHDLQTCEQVQALEGHSKAVVRLAWSPDEKQPKLFLTLT